METMEEGQNLPKIHPKRRKSQEIVEKEEDDRISTLPDCLLLEILSHLPSTKGVITTGTLSKRWEHLWTLVPILIFEQNDYKQSWSDFILLVDKTLAQCRHSKLKKFKVRCTRYHYQHLTRPNDWIRYAVRCNVEELNLTLGNAVYPDLQVDESIFTASCLTNLRLSDCELNPTGAISWKKLKSLCITFGDVDEVLIENILSGSPLLENLELDGCSGFNRLDIHSKSVKNLVLTPYVDVLDEYDDSDYEITINAPNISSLAIQGDLCLWKVLLVDVSSLVEAKLDYRNDDETMPNEEEEEEMLKGLILKLRHVKELKIGASCSKVLSRLEAKGFITPLNLKFIDVKND